MSYLRVAPLLLLTVWPASAQTVRSTRSGLLYFFDGYVFIGDEQVQQRFGRFPEIGEGRVLRTELGRAEVLLTPGVTLRVDENSAIRLLSDSLSDTRIELLRGSAIIEASREAANPPDTLIYKSWQVHVPEGSVARINAEPAQVRVLSGTAVVSTEGTRESVTVQRSQILPLSTVLVAEPVTPAADDFNIWAMNRSSVVSEDNSIGAGITDDPDQIDTSGAALGSFSYFPQTGIPSLGITYPYGLSYWSPYQTWLNPSVSPYLSFYPYGLLNSRVPVRTLLYPRPSGSTQPIGRPSGPKYPRPSYLPPPRPPMVVPHVAAPHPIRR